MIKIQRKVGMEIKKAQKKDFDIMTHIFSECVSLTCEFLTTSEIKKLEEVFKDKYLNDPELIYFTQEEHGEVFGFACIRGKEVLFSPIDPRLFGRGYGEQMMEYLFENYEVDTAYVYSLDMHSLAFYTAIGFVIEDKIEDIFFNNSYELNRLKLSISPKEAAKRIAAKH